jgi:tetratricopeptide (TPR) repeat protein
MSRALLFLIAAVVLLTVVSQAGVLPPAAQEVAWLLVRTLWWLLLMVLPLVYWAAPGLFHRLDGTLGHFAARFGHGRHEAGELLARIDHMGKPHHMLQLGHLYLHQGRLRKAAQWLRRALELDPDLLEARYKLAHCYFAQHKTAEAAELFEQVRAAKPNHDYGMLDLRLAQSHQRLGNYPRAREVYERLLRFYPGHAEGSYHFALLAADEGRREQSRKLMGEVITSVHRSPRFQRRRTRHWAWKARWWLWTRR